MKEWNKKIQWLKNNCLHSAQQTGCMVKVKFVRPSTS